MSTELSDWERHLLSDRELRDRCWELRLRLGTLALIGIGCAAGLAVGRWGVNVSEVVRGVLWAVMVASFAGVVSAWREWRYVALLRKVMRRLLELEARGVGTERANESLPIGDEPA